MAAQSDSEADDTAHDGNALAEAAPPISPPPWRRLRETLPLLMSVLAFVVSLSSLYFSVLRAGNVAAMTGPVLALSHDPLTGVAQVSVAINLANTGARLITVTELQLEIQKPAGEQRFTLQAVTQQAMDQEGEPKDLSLLAPITLPPRSESTRQLRFAGSTADVALTQAGVYRCRLLLRLSGREAPVQAEHWQLELTDLDAGQLRHWYELNIGRTVLVTKRLPTE
jgi:hypothetical protein